MQSAVAREVVTDHRRTVEPPPIDRQVEGRERTHGMHAGQAPERLVDALVERPREDRGEDEIARHDVRDPCARGGPGMLADATERDDECQPDRECSDGQRRPRAVAQDRRPGESLLQARERDERQAADACQRREQDRDEQCDAQEDRVDHEGTDKRTLARRARPDEESEQADCDEDADEPAEPGAPGRRQLEAGLERLDGGDATGPASGFDGCGERHTQTDDDRRERVDRPDDRRAHRHVPDGPQPRGDARGQRPADDDAERGAEDADDGCLDEDVRGELPTRGTGRAQQTELADTLDDRHRQRVEDQERPREERDRSDKGGRRGEVAGRRFHRRGKVAWRRDRVRLRKERRLERVDDRGRVRPGDQVQVDASHALGAEHRQRDGQVRDDHAARRTAPRAVGGEDARDAEVERFIDPLDAEPGADGDAVLPGERRADERGRLVTRGQRGPGRHRHVVDGRLTLRVDPDERDRRGEWPGPELVDAEVRASLERRRGDGDTGRSFDQPERRVGQSRLAERPDPQFGGADQRADSAIDSGHDPGVRRQACVQHRHPQRDAECRERRPQRTGAKPAPRKAVESAHPYPRIPRARGWPGGR